MQLIANKLIGIRLINGDDHWVMCREESKTAMFPPYRWESMNNYWSGMHVFSEDQVRRHKVQ